MGTGSGIFSNKSLGPASHLANPNNEDSLHVHYRVATLGPESEHGCGGTDEPVGYGDPHVGPENGCHVWSEPYVLSSTLTDIRYVAAYGYGGKDVFLSLQSVDGALDALHVTIGSSGVLTIEDEQNITNDAQGRPDISVVYASSAASVGWTERLTLVHNEPFGGVDLHVAHYLNSSGNFVPCSGFSVGHGPGAGNHWIQGPGGATLAPWPHHDHNAPQVNDDDRVTCAIFTGANNAMRPYCFDPEDVRWVDVTDTMCGEMPDTEQTCGEERAWVSNAGSTGRCIPTSITPPNLAFRYLRTDSGNVYLDARGNYGLTYHRPNQSNRARLWVSTLVSPQAPYHPLSGGGVFDHWDTVFYNGWFNQGWNYISIQQFDSPTTGGAAALTARKSSGNWRERGIFVYPFASGSFNSDITVGSDYRIMREYTCLWMAHEEDVPVICKDPFVL